MTVTHYFTGGRYRQTAGEQRRDMRTMRKLRRDLEAAIPRSQLLIDEAVEWGTVWRIPFLIADTMVSENHFMVVRGYGASLKLHETFDDHNASYVVTLDKTREPLRSYSTLDKAFFISSILGLTTFATLSIRYVSGLYALGL